MDFSKKINTGKFSQNSPFKKGKTPTRPMRVQVPYYEKIRDYAFKKELPKATILNKIIQYGLHDYDRYQRMNKSNK